MQRGIRQVARLGSLCIAFTLAGCCVNRSHTRSADAWYGPATASDTGRTASRSTLLGFLNPDAGSESDAGLIFLKPYQPGKIPVVFVHGLLSSPDTWTDLVAELRCRPEINARYQFWAFGYPTGVSFVRSAARLREDIYETVDRLDPTGGDPALRRIVLVGHSMGGLVSKLQVTDSGPCVWSSIANRPLGSICTDEATRNRLQSRLFFHPNPYVERVIFIAVPHRGSSFAGRFVGRVGSALVELPADDEGRHRQLVRDNPNTFADFVRGHLPTSVDMLQPGNPMLEAIETLPVSSRVRLHSIIGDGWPMLARGPGDGVVPVSSAWHAGVDSELYVPTTHRWIHRDPDTAAEVARILREHAVEFP